MIVNDINILNPFNEDGDFLIENSDLQNIQAILIAEPGQFYEFPTLGVGINGAINASDDLRALNARIVNNLSKDGYKLNDFNIDFNQSGQANIYIDAQKIN